MPKTLTEALADLRRINADTNRRIDALMAECERERAKRPEDDGRILSAFMAQIGAVRSERIPYYEAVRAAKAKAESAAMIRHAAEATRQAELLAAARAAGEPVVAIGGAPAEASGG